MLGEEGRWMSFVSQTLKINVNDAQNKEVYSKKNLAVYFVVEFLQKIATKPDLGRQILFLSN